VLPVAHSAGARVLHGWTAGEGSEANLTGSLTLGKITAKGDSLVGTGLHVLDALAIGADGLVLLADSGQATGQRWGQADSEGIAANSINLTHIQNTILDDSKVAAGFRFMQTAADAAGVLALVADTGDVATQQDNGAVLRFNGTDWTIISVKPQQQTVTGGPTSGTTELTLATLTVSAFAATYAVECAANWSARDNTNDGTYKFRIRVDGTEVGAVTQRHEVNNLRLAYSLPTTTLTTISVSAATTITCTVQQISGTGTLIEETAGRLTAHFWPA